MFTPFPTGTKTLVVNTPATTTSIQFGAGQTTGTGSVRLYATGATMFYNFGLNAAGVTATVSCVPLPAGIVEIVDVGNADTVAAFCATSGILYITPVMGSDS